jgi:hypothetical protein
MNSASKFGLGMIALVVGVVIAYAIGKEDGKEDFSDEVKDAVEKGGKFKVGEVNVVQEVDKNSAKGKALDRDGYVVEVFLKGEETKFVEEKNKFQYSPDKKYYEEPAEVKS